MQNRRLRYFIFLLSCIFSVFAFAADLRVSQGQESAMLGALMVINSNEIAAAQIAEERSTNPAVKQFAKTMINDHSNNLQAIKELSTKINISPSASKASEELAENGKKELDSLKALPADKFNKAYIDAMVKGHEKALQVLDKVFIPNAHNTDLVNFLKNTRDTVAHHLEMAKNVQKQL